MSCNANNTVARARGDWDAAAFFERLTGANRLARELGFRFCRVSGLQGLEDLLASMTSATAFVAVSDESDGTIELLTTPHSRRIKTVFLARRHQLDNMAARNAAMASLRELFRQFMSVLLRERTRISEGFVYIDERIVFTEIDRYFASGCACAVFQIAVDIYEDMQYREHEWNFE